MKNTILFTLLCFAVGNSYGQTESLSSRIGNQEKIGDKLSSNLAYADALSAYNEAWERNETPELSLKIAQTYTMLNDQQNAAKWYEMSLKNSGENAPENALYYADALSSTENYVDAESWYSKSAAAFAGDSRPARKISSLKNQDELYENVSYVKIMEAEFNSPASDFSPTFMNEKLVFVSARSNARLIKRKFAWDNTNFLDLYYSNSSEVSEFDRSINSPLHEGPAVFYEDGKKMIFTRNNSKKGRLKRDSTGTTNLKLFYAQLDESANSWSAPEPLPFNNDAYSVGHPAINSTGSVLYFASNMPGGFGKTDLYKSEFINGEWREPVNLGKEINTEGDEMFPFLFQEDQLYFAGNGYGGLGGLDLYKANLKNNEVSNLGSPINSSSDDFGLLLNPDGKSGYFSSNRKGKGSDDIFEFSSSKDVVSELLIREIILDKMEFEPIQGIRLSLLDKDGNEIASTTSSDGGQYSFSLEPNKKYSVKTQGQEGYLDQNEIFNTLESAEKLEIEKNFMLVKNEGFFLTGKVNNAKTSEILTGVKITIVDNSNGKEVLTGITGNDGDITYSITDYKLNDKISYLINLKKEGYLGKNMVINSSLDKPGAIDLNAFLDVSLNKLEVGCDIGKLIDVQPIYFDSGKWNINESAGTELQKIVAVMKEHETLRIELGSHTDAVEAQLPIKICLKNEQKHLQSTSYLRALTKTELLP